MAVVLGIAALAVFIAGTPNLAVVIAIYIAMQMAYCFGLKHQAVLDICIVSSAYLIRAIAGGAAAGIPLSQWFLLVMTFGSLFMVGGQALRRTATGRADRVPRSASRWRATRPAICASSGRCRRRPWCSATGCGPSSATATNASWYAVTMIPFTIAILRYAVDVDGGLAGEPEEIALKDRVLQLLAVAWIGTIGAAVFLS